VKLSDFGIAKTRAHSSSGGSTGNIRGKLAYASPEQLEDLPLDHRTDQFALGITMWELLAGRRLFEGADEMEVMTKVSHCQIPPFSSLPAARDIAPEVETVVRRMLYRRPEDRFPTTAEALSAVLTLPGYSADGVPLGNLVKRLFSTQTDFPATGPLVLSPPPPAPVAASALPATQTIQPPPNIRTPRPRDSGTRSVRPGASPGRSSSRISSQVTRRLGRQPAAAGTRARGRGWLLLIGGLALIGAAIGLWLARLRTVEPDDDASGVDSDSSPRAAVVRRPAAVVSAGGPAPVVATPPDPAPVSVPLPLPLPLPAPAPATAIDSRTGPRTPGAGLETTRPWRPVEALPQPVRVDAGAPPAVDTVSRPQPGGTPRPSANAAPIVE